ncbi:MAG: sigma-54-dependent Fis family transcriptional regulator [Deltaproteobacteria bacterium]|nr:sigma-54-dependent Fis family transcriptional regulator [Deltaproteobacteria bacterium]MBW2018945.1 sigma-54-dependent Fis family transcriptional regulator [Deltaproteobacteria bacterium]MBW2073160.1 sigma-54-dependent Fis family transcriptional regulator [Deltaproteobacteria bacterium]RLB83779.1 MAG: sigma-54-dependent Fis family transcriptional regulator [Deltaproteobacteria bacterium]
MIAPMQKILIVDDDPEILEVIADILREKGYDVGTAEDGAKAIKCIDAEFYDLVITDLKMPEIDGMMLLRHVVDQSPDTVCIILTGYGTIESAVEAIKTGAFHYITKPIKSGEMLMVVETALRYKHLERENILLRRQLRKKYRFENFVGDSRPIQKVFELIEKVADTDSTVLITGESGTGKELIAKAIHYNSDRRDKPMVVINCGAIPEELLESELFGHEKGAFTGAHKTRIGRFELANEGTIFLDEIGDMSPNLQVKLLRVLQEQKFERVGSTRTIKVDIRIIAATNQNLVNAVNKNTFREDLYYRLNVIPIKVPPLRHRKSDIPLLVDFFVKKFNKEKRKHVKEFTAEAMDLLLQYDWPGNVRELENLVERVIILANSDQIGLDDVPDSIKGRVEKIGSPEPTIPKGGIPFDHAVEEYEKKLILQALNETNWVKTKAAKLLNMNRTTLIEKMKKKKLYRPAASS